MFSANEKNKGAWGALEKGREKGSGQAEDVHLDEPWARRTYGIYGGPKNSIKEAFNTIKESFETAFQYFLDNRTDYDFIAHPNTLDNMGYYQGIWEKELTGEDDVKILNENLSEWLKTDKISENDKEIKDYKIDSRVIKEPYPGQDEKINVLDYKNIFLPFSFGNFHWILVWIDHERKKITVYDSLQNKKNPESYKKSIEDSIKGLDFLVYRGDPQKWEDRYMKNIDIVQNIPQQPDRSQCGVYVLAYLEYILFKDITRFPEKFNYIYYRRKILKDLFNSGTDQTYNPLLRRSSRKRGSIKRFAKNDVDSGKKNGLSEEDDTTSESGEDNGSDDSYVPNYGSQSSDADDNDLFTENKTERKSEKHQGRLYDSDSKSEDDNQSDSESLLGF